MGENRNQVQIHDKMHTMWSCTVAEVKLDISSEKSCWLADQRMQQESHGHLRMGPHQFLWITGPEWISSVVGHRRDTVDGI